MSPRSAVVALFCVLGLMVGGMVLALGSALATNQGGPRQLLPRNYHEDQAWEGGQGNRCGCGKRTQHSLGKTNRQLASEGPAWHL